MKDIFANDVVPSFIFFETDPTAFQTVHVYNPMSSSPAIKIVKQLSAFSPPRYLSHGT